MNRGKRNSLAPSHLSDYEQCNADSETKTSIIYMVRNNNTKQYILYRRHVQDCTYFEQHGAHCEDSRVRDRRNAS